VPIAKALAVGAPMEPYYHSHRGRLATSGVLPCAVSWLISVFTAAAVVVPVAQMLAEWLRNRRLNARWRRAATALGLAVEWPFPSLVVRGEFRGVTIELMQIVVPRYKKAPMFEWKLRAQLSTIKELESAYREPRVSALATRDPDEEDAAATTQVAGDWVERAGVGVLDPDTLAIWLTWIARRARVEADRDSFQK
jgi:hypothetical protein